MEKIYKWISQSLMKAGWAPILIFSIHMIAIYPLNIYSFFSDFDIIMHFLGGMSMSYFFIYLLRYADQERLLGQPSFFVLVSLVFLLTTTTTVFWEFAEWLSDIFLHTYTQSSLGDTLLDMALGILGGSLLLFLMKRKLKS